MVSAIDATKPADGELPSKADFRANLASAKSEIEALQAEVVALLGALQLTSGESLFPVISGDNLPDVEANLATILQSLDAAISAIGSPSSIDGALLTDKSLPASAFPDVLDLGGTKQTGGGRGIIVPIAGNHTFVQSNAGNKTLEHTGGGAATWNVPALLPGTTIDIDNAIGGPITFNDTGSQTFVGGTTLSTGNAGAIKWLNGGRVRLFGTI